LSDWLVRESPNINPAVHRVIAFLGVFLAVYLVLYLITHFVHKTIQASKLEMLDRVLGAFLGAIKMAAVSACACAVMVALDLQIFKEWFEHATVAPYFAKGTDVVVSWIPASYREQIDQGITTVREQLQQRIADAANDAINGEPAKR
jgi:uncharacterized membrane protein required for colicin V production